MNWFFACSYTVEHHLLIGTGWDQRVSAQITGMKHHITTSNYHYMCSIQISVTIITRLDVACIVNFIYARCH